MQLQQTASRSSPESFQGEKISSLESIVFVRAQFMRESEIRRQEAWMKCRTNAGLPAFLLTPGY